jgi:hypothetical protein
MYFDLAAGHTVLAFRRVFPLRPLQWAPERVYLGMKRLVMTESVEPPPTSTVPERPCEVALAQDSIYNSCWQEPFSQILPYERGLHYYSISMEANSLQNGLDVLTQDLSSLPNVVLVARGPIVSLIAQYYLESLPLAGLILVDPILIDHEHILHRLEARLERDSSQHQFVKELLSTEEPRQLKLEPGAVPMLVFQSLQDESFKMASTDVAHRLGDPDGLFGEILVQDISSTEADSLVAIDLITEWIDETVL